MANNASWLRGVVLGLDDGLVTTLVTIMTVSSIVGGLLLKTMIGVVLAGAISMTLGGFGSAFFAEDKNSVVEGLQTGCAFLVGGLAPLLPVFLGLPQVHWLSYGCAVLFAIGFVFLKACYVESTHSAWKSAMLNLAIVTVGTLAGVVIGVVL